MFASRTNWNLTPNPLAAALEERRAAGKETLDLTESNPTRCGFDYEPQAILGAPAQPEALRYEPDSRGLRVAREAVARYYRDQAAKLGAMATLASAEHIVLTASTSEAYSFLFRLLCEPGDEVLAPAPSYPLLEYLASLQDVRLVHYPLFYDRGWQTDLKALEAALTPRSRALVVVHPNNPTGSFVKPMEADVLTRLCAERGLALIADEVFLDFAHDGRPHPSFFLCQETLTFTLSGLSKLCGLPQLKVGWIAASGPQQLLHSALARLEVIADTYLSVNTPAQLALAGLLDRRAGFQKQVRARVTDNLVEMDRQLADHPAFRRLEAEGGWYAVVRIPVLRSDEELCLRLLREEGVLAHPGHFYDFSGEGHLVTSLVLPSSAFAEGLKALLKVAENP
ncbi:MAG: pyridoxal phosphate-dependent aminotransferase [Acidobacteria bacterium]|nr:pyridoxal phosphate-dependent aminotransferase [Acidobacteriota bacterium]